MLIKAVLFDMDGVLVNSEPLWRIAMIKGFQDLGIDFTEEDCKTTTGLRFDEVVNHWYEIYKWKGKTPQQLHDEVIDNLCRLIFIEGETMEGVIESLNLCKKNNLKIGLATSSNTKIIKAVIQKLKIETYFEAIVSAENLKYGKPHPEVFLACAEGLKIGTKNCLVIEDSVNGVIAGKAAGMRVVAVPDSYHYDNPRFSIADFKIPSLIQFEQKFLY